MKGYSHKSNSNLFGTFSGKCQLTHQLQDLNNTTGSNVWTSHTSIKKLSCFLKHFSTDSTDQIHQLANLKWHLRRNNELKNIITFSNLRIVENSQETRRIFTLPGCDVLIFHHIKHHGLSGRHNLTSEPSYQEERSKKITSWISQLGNHANSDLI